MDRKKSGGSNELRKVCSDIQKTVGDKGRIISREQVCKMLGISQSTLNQKTRIRIIPCHKMPGYKKLIYYENEIHAFIQYFKTKV